MIKTKYITTALSVLLLMAMVVNVIFYHQMRSAYEDEPPHTSDGLHYQARANGHIGKLFSVSKKLLYDLGIPPREFPRAPNNVLATKFVFVTYASDAFYLQLADAAKAIQQLKPPKNLVVYDIGLTNEQADKIRSWCFVKYRKFDFSKYPPHVASLDSYAFKAMIWKETFEEYDAAFFIDATVHVNADTFQPVIEQAVKSGGFLLFSGTGHSTFAATDPRMYDYFPVDLMALRELEQLEADAFIIRNKFTYWGILHWLYLCALDPNCISPKSSTRFCVFGEERFQSYAKCHRYDQSVLNILALDLYKGDREVWRYPNIVGLIYEIRRIPKKTEEENIHKCI